MDFKLVKGNRDSFDPGKALSPEDEAIRRSLARQNKLKPPPEVKKTPPPKVELSPSDKLFIIKQKRRKK